MPKNKKDLVLFYPTADEKMVDIWAYSSQWGENHADRYTEALYRAINKQRDDSLHRPFPRTKTADITDEQIIFSSGSINQIPPPIQFFTGYCWAQSSLSFRYLQENANLFIKVSLCY